MKVIDAVSELDPIQFHKNYFQKHQPVLIKGGVKDTAYFDKWSLDYLNTKFHSRKVKVFHCKTGYYNFNIKGQMERIEMPFSRAVEYFVGEEDTSKSHYMQQVAIAEFFPELMEDLSRPKWNLPADLINEMNLWVGGAGCVTPLHFDHAHNFLIQVRGLKELTLFSPADSANLYPSDQGAGHLSQIYLDQVDEEKFPLFRNATPFHCSLEAGDVLFIPPGWWHHVRSMEACISVNFWWNRFELIDGIGLEHASVDEMCQNIKRFTERGVSIDQKNVDGETMLLTAIQKGHVNIVKALLKMGAQANVKSEVYSPGNTALSFAQELNNDSIISLLLEYGASDSSAEVKINTQVTNQN